MQAYLVVLDGTPISWEAAYSAFHLAARLGARLIGVAARNPAGERTASQWLAEFETGARAAGISVESRLLVNLDAATLETQAGGADGVFWGHPGGAPSGTLLSDLIDRPPCALWLVPRQTSVRHIVLLHPGSSAGSEADRFARLLSRRLGVDLHTLAYSDIPTADGGLGVAAIRDAVANAGADLLILDRDENPPLLHELVDQPPCLMACLPP